MKTSALPVPSSAFLASFSMPELGRGNAERGVKSRKDGTSFTSALVWLTIFGALSACAQAAEQTGISTRGPITASRLTTIKPDLSVAMSLAGKPATYTAAELVLWGAFGESERGPLLLLADGSCLLADVIGLSKDELRVESRLFGMLTLDRAYVRAIVFRLPADRQARDRLLARLTSRRDPQDLLLLANGDELLGRASDYQFDADTGVETLQFTAAGSAMSSAVGLSRVAAVAMNPVLVQDAAVRDKHLLVGWRDGSRLVVTQVAAAAGEPPAGRNIEFTLASGVKIELPLSAIPEDVVAIQPLGTAIRYLSDLPTSGYKHIPFLATDWPYHNDRNSLGMRLRAGGALYPKGLGMHSTSRLSYDLPVGYRRFAAELAIDDLTAGGGSVICRVYLDGGDGAWRPAYASPVIRGGDAPLPISVDIASAKRLALIVDFAERGDELDHINWLNARLIP